MWGQNFNSSLLQRYSGGNHPVQISDTLLAILIGFPSSFLASPDACKECNLKQATTVSSQILAYSALMIVFSTHLTLYNLYSWNSVVKNPRTNHILTKEAYAWPKLTQLVIHKSFYYIDRSQECTRAYPEVSGLAAWSKNCKHYSCH
jgi:hypothetical protein